MNTLFHLRTPRLLLRRWRADDFAEFAKLNSDSEVMRYFPDVLAATESDALAHRISSTVEEQGWGLWAAESRPVDGAEGAGEFLGFIGLGHNDVTPRGELVEVGWRLRRTSWGQGLATEGAKAALVFAFEILKLPEIFSFTSTGNSRSRAVMQRLGMENTNENFMHPKVEQGSPLREHVLYRISAEQFDCDVPVEIEAVGRS